MCSKDPTSGLLRDTPRKGKLQHGNLYHLLYLHTSVGIMLLLIPTNTHSLLRQNPLSHMRFCEQQIDVFKTPPCRFWAQEPHKGYCYPIRKQHPYPDLPSDVLERDTASEHCDEAEQPFAKGSGRSTYMSVLEGCDLILSVHVEMSKTG